jgi:hypothetical protein
MAPIQISDMTRPEISIMDGLRSRRDGVFQIARATIKFNTVCEQPCNQVKC